MQAIVEGADDPFELVMTIVAAVILVLSVAWVSWGTTLIRVIDLCVGGAC